MTPAIVAFALAAACLAIGRWGRRNAADLVPSSLSAYGQAKQERSLRRGAWSLTAFGLLLAVLGVVSGVDAAMAIGR